MIILQSYHFGSLRSRTLPLCHISSPQYWIHTLIRFHHVKVKPQYIPIHILGCVTCPWPVPLEVTHTPTVTPFPRQSLKAKITISLDPPKRTQPGKKPELYKRFSDAFCALTFSGPFCTLTFSSLSAPQTSSSTTSRELLSQFSACSGWR